MLKPAIQAFPEVGLKSPVNIEIVVVLPAPFGPSNPNTSPFLIFKQNFYTAILVFHPLLYSFLKSFTISGYL